MPPARIRSKRSLETRIMETGVIRIILGISPSEENRVLLDGVGYSDGAQGRNRTTDTRIFNPLLYRLSYLGLSLLLRSSILR